MSSHPQILQGRYEIKRYLSKKAGQQTLLAKDKQTQNLVVIKLLTFGAELQWQTFKLFEREAKTLQELEHSAIPRYLDYFDLETKFGQGFALVQSYIDAPCLEEHIKVGRTFSEVELKQIAKAVLEILTYLHHRSPPIIHRDLKPANILLTNRSGHSVGQVYLVDFGSVQAAAQDSGTRTIVGSYGYMPPEQFGARAVPASDLYSLGATIIYLASGQHPADLPQKDLRIDFQNYVSISSDFIDWLRWMTQPSLEKRLQSAKDALEALENPKLPSLEKKSSLIISKPAGSKVVLNKGDNYLEIGIPPKSFKLKLSPAIVFKIVWNRVVLPCFSGAILIWIVGGWFGNFFLLVFLWSGINSIINILFAIFGVTWLHVDQETISLRYQLFDFKYYRLGKEKRSQLTKLERTKTYYRENAKGHRFKVKSQINIWAGDKKFPLGGNGLLSDIELDWLAYELSEWLDLPIIEDLPIVKD